MEYYVLRRVNYDEYLKKIGDNDAVFTYDIHNALHFDSIGHALFLKESVDQVSNEQVEVLRCSLSLTPIEVVIKNKPMDSGDDFDLI